MRPRADVPAARRERADVPAARPDRGESLVNEVDVPRA
jgi:hypothetical protein